MNVVVYTDASYSHIEKIAACGYLALVKDYSMKHQITLMSKIENVFIAEVHSVIFGLQNTFLMKGVESITVFTEIDIIIKWEFSKKLLKRKYINELIDTAEIITEHGIGLCFKKVKAHSGQKWNNKIDKSVGWALRQHLKNIPNGKGKEAIKSNA